MTIAEAAQKWGYSANWVRELVKTGRVKATFRTDVPVPYWDIHDQPCPSRTASALSGAVRETLTKKKKAVASDAAEE